MYVYTPSGISDVLLIMEKARHQNRAGSVAQVLVLPANVVESNWNSGPGAVPGANRPRDCSRAR